MLTRDDTVLLVIDFQEKLLPKIAEADAVAGQAIKLIRFARELDIPILWSEQYKKGLGGTPAELAQHLEGVTPHEKLSFGCLGDDAYKQSLIALNRRQLLVTGIEAHVCVLQTVLAARDASYEVYVVKDAVGAQHQIDRDTAFDRMHAAGAVVATAQMAMFELLREAGTPEFKQVFSLLK